MPCKLIIPYCPQGLPGGSEGGKESAWYARDPALIPGSGRSSGEGMVTHSSTPAWKSLWMKRAWWVIVHGVAQSHTPLFLAVKTDHKSTKGLCFNDGDRGEERSVESHFPILYTRDIENVAIKH